MRMEKWQRNVIYPVRLATVTAQFGRTAAIHDAVRLAIKSGSIYSTGSSGPGQLRGYWATEADWNAAQPPQHPDTAAA